MKIAVIGGGSTYTPELLNGFLARSASIPLSELWLMDVDPARLEVVGGFARRMAAAKGAAFQVQLTSDRKAAIADADYVIAQLRVGQSRARVADEYLGRRYGLVGQETTGVGGMAKALRTIPVILEIAAEMKSLAPGALLINFTNPSGLVTEALNRYGGGVAAVGVCNSALTTKMGILDGLEKQMGMSVAPERAEIQTLGLNHLTWYRGFTVDGADLWPQVIQGLLAELRAAPEPEWDPRTIETLQMLPNSYLQYYYYTDHKLALQEKWPPSRGEAVMAIEKDLLAAYAEPGRSEPPDDLMKRGGAYYSTVATQLIQAHHNDLGKTHVANVRQGGAVPGWPEDWVLEMPCRVDRAGIHPLPAEPLPPVCFGLIAQVKAYELLTVEAAVYGDRKAAYEALLAHPLGPAADRVQAVLDDLLVTHKAYLPRFA
jgi:6-phospho-beta-glucosidase